MSVDKVEDVRYVWQDGNPLIFIDFKDYWTPILVDTHYADYLTLWWDCDASEYDPAMKLYAVTEVDDADDLVSKVEEWYDLDIPEALAYAKENHI